MKRKTLGVILPFVTILVGCGINGEKQTQTTNVQVKVTLLFENDGCKVYRFMDYGEPVYYVDCRTNGSTQVSANWSRMEGSVEHQLQSTTVNR